MEKRFRENGNELTLRTYKRPGVYGRYIGIIVFPDSDVSINDGLIQKGHAKKV